ncbi:hypothetical protein GQX74_010963 [Glossina fuscipes]|nr:hypothetical protein GQX74_010963 [Glossina fuscipes]
MKDIYQDVLKEIDGVNRPLMRECPQLDIQLNDEENLLLDSCQCKWHNCTLNSMQKKAVANILRGEVYNMPYVIFGSPGKNAKLVESILQIFKLTPSAHLLVGTSSNSSADLIMTRLIESAVLKMGDLKGVASHNEFKEELTPKHLMPYCATGDRYWDTGIDDTCKDDMIIALNPKSNISLCQGKYFIQNQEELAIYFYKSLLTVCSNTADNN